MRTGQFNSRCLGEFLRGPKKIMDGKTFAKRLAVSPSTVSSWLCGRYAPRVSMISKMAKVLKVDESLLHNVSAEDVQDIYEARLRELIANQPEHVKAKILAMVAEELASREREGSGEAEGKKDGK